MSKSPYLSNPNILAHPDRIVQKVELDMTAQDSYLAGSPISAEGKLANDQTAIGILLYDVHKAIGGRTGVVVIFGRIQQDVAAEHSGITISAEAKAALIDVTFTGDGSRMGGGGLSELPEGYPYKEGSKTVIEWDGNTDGVPTYDGMTYHVSDKIPSNDDLKALSLVASNGMTIAMDESAWDGYVSSGAVKDDYAFLLNHLVVVTRVPNVRYNNITFVEPGVYLGVQEGLHIAKLTYGIEIIHTMAPEFLPLLTSPNGTKYKLAVSDDGTLSAVAVS